MSKVIAMWEHDTWGDSIFWLDYTTMKVSGHMTPKPKPGDKMLCQMQSGKVAEFEFVSVDNAWGVRDQFFAKVKFLNYQGEKPKGSLDKINAWFNDLS